MLGLKSRHKKCDKISRIKYYAVAWGLIVTRKKEKKSNDILLEFIDFNPKSRLIKEM